MIRPGWRNWQTRRTQNPVLAREWEFDPPSGHHGPPANGRNFGKTPIGAGPLSPPEFPLTALSQLAYIFAVDAGTSSEITTTVFLSSIIHIFTHKEAAHA